MLLIQTVLSIFPCIEDLSGIYIGLFIRFSSLNKVTSITNYYLFLIRYIICHCPRWVNHPFIYKILILFVNLTRIHQGRSSVMATSPVHLYLLDLMSETALSILGCIWFINSLSTGKALVNKWKRSGNNWIIKLIDSSTCSSCIQIFPLIWRIMLSRSLWIKNQTTSKVLVRALIVLIRSL